MFFDRNEIHIQAFVDFINGKLIIFRSSSPQTYFEDIYSKNRYKIDTKHISKKYIQKMMGLPFEKFRKFCLSDLEK